MYNVVTEAVVAYIKAQYDCAPEFLWARTPNNAAIRHRENRKWFAALMLALPLKHLGLTNGGCADVINLKCDPRMIGSLVDGKRYFPGYHMNKEHWITVLLDGSIPAGEICPLIDLSFDLTAQKKR